MDDFNWTDEKPIAGMKPWACSYTKDGSTRFGITLYGTDAQQVLNDNCADLDGLRVDGEVVSTSRGQVK